MTVIGELFAEYVSTLSKGVPKFWIGKTKTKKRKYRMKIHLLDKFMRILSGYSKNVNGELKWATGEKAFVAQGRWDIGQPDTTYGNCVVLTSNHRWSHHWCSDKLPFVCEAVACTKGFLLL